MRQTRRLWPWVFVLFLAGCLGKATPTAVAPISLPRKATRIPAPTHTSTALPTPTVPPTPTATPTPLPLNVETLFRLRPQVQSIWEGLAPVLKDFTWWDDQHLLAWGRWHQRRFMSLYRVPEFHEVYRLVDRFPLTRLEDATLVVVRLEKERPVALEQGDPLSNRWEPYPLPEDAQARLQQAPWPEAVGLSPDGQWLAVLLGKEGQDTLWLFNLRENTSTSLTISGRGESVHFAGPTRVLVNTSRGQAVLVGLPEAKVLHTFPNRVAAFSPTYERAWLATLILVDLINARTLTPVKSHFIYTPGKNQRQIGLLARAGTFDPQGRPWVFYGSFTDRQSVAISLEDERILKFPEGGPILLAAYNPQGDTLATASADGRFRLWSLQGELKARSPLLWYRVTSWDERPLAFPQILPHEELRAQIQWAPNRNYWAQRLGHQTLHVYRLPDGKQVQEIQVSGLIQDWTWAGEMLVTLYAPDIVELPPPSKEKKPSLRIAGYSIPEGDRRFQYKLSFTACLGDAQGKYLLCHSSKAGRNVRLVDLKTGKIVAYFPAGDVFNPGWMAFSPKGDWVAFACPAQGYEVFVYPLPGNESDPWKVLSSTVFSERRLGCHSLAFTPDGRYLVLGSGALLDLEAREVISTWDAPTDWVTRVLIAPQGDFAILQTAGPDRVIALPEGQPVGWIRIGDESVPSGGPTLQLPQETVTYTLLAQGLAVILPQEVQIWQASP